MPFQRARRPSSRADNPKIGALGVGYIFHKLSYSNKQAHHFFYSKCGETQTMSLAPDERGSVSSVGGFQRAARQRERRPPSFSSDLVSASSLSLLCLWCTYVSTVNEVL